MKSVSLGFLGLVICSSVIAKAEVAFEAPLKERVSQSKDLIELMDNLDPSEISELFQLQADDVEMVPENMANSGTVAIHVSVPEQRVYVRSPEGDFHAAVSTGRDDNSRRTHYRTVRGCFRALSKNRMHYSKKYDNAPMPNAVFFHPAGYAIHATYETKKLGRPASHGCVRVSMATSKEIFRLVSTYGLQNTTVCVGE